MICRHPLEIQERASFVEVMSVRISCGLVSGSTSLDRFSENNIKETFIKSFQVVPVFRHVRSQWSLVYTKLEISVPIYSIKNLESLLKYSVEYFRLKSSMLNILIVTIIDPLRRLVYVMLHTGFSVYRIRLLQIIAKFHVESFLICIVAYNCILIIWYHLKFICLGQKKFYFIISWLGISAWDEHYNQITSYFYMNKDYYCTNLT
jgi:hypothetical protein